MAMFDLHIEEFFIDCFAVLSQLYQSFPSARAVFVEDISGPDNPDEYGVHSKRFQACFGAMLWLEKEGYLVYETTIRQEAIDQACLTSKGLLLLSRTAYDPSLQALRESLETVDESLPGKPNIDTLKHLHRHGTSTQLALAMRFLIGQTHHNET